MASIGCGSVFLSLLLSILALSEVVGPTEGASSNRTLIRVISDLHLGSSWFTNSEHKKLLTKFFNDLASPNTTVKELVIMGDVIELWLYAFNVTPLNTSQVIKSTNLHKTNVASYIKQLKQIANNNVLISLVIGNHDMEMKWSKQDMINAISKKNLIIYDEEYIYKKKIRFEHGHRYDLFNAPDPRGYRPVGYYMSRAVETVNYDGSGNSGTTIKLCQEVPVDVIADFSIPILRSSTIFGLVITHMFSTVLGSYDDYKKTPIVDGYWQYNVSKEIVLDEAHDKYTNLVDVWYKWFKKNEKNEDPDDMTFALLKGGCGDFSYYVQKLGDPIIIFGHTHIAKEPKTYKNDNGGKTTYVNSGAWVNAGSMTYVDIKESSGGKFTLKLLSFKSSSKSSTFVTTTHWKKTVRT